jgi:hypothetical protein
MEPVAAFQILMLTVAAAMAVEAFKTAGITRVVFWAVFVICALIGILTNKIAAAWPAASSAMAWVGSSPVTLFLIFLGWISFLQKPWRRDPAPTAMPAVPAPVESDMPTPAQRLENRIKIIAGCRGAVIGFRDVRGFFSDYVESGASFMMIRRHLDPAFLEEIERTRHSAADQSVAGELPDLAKRFLHEVDKVAERWGIE